MWSALLSASSLLVGSLALNSPGTPHYYEFQVEIKSYCLEGLKDPHGNAPSCSTATAVATQGLTLPGMDDGTLTTRAHVIAGSDGSETMVEAHPSHPYQYFMRTSTAGSTTVERLVDGKAVLVGEAPTGADSPPFTTFDSMTLEDAGWSPHGMVEKDGVMVNKWVKESYD
ncbi:hypothetical protein FOZ63_001975, partial [Perkinsus olseni]